MGLSEGTGAGLPGRARAAPPRALQPCRVAAALRSWQCSRCQTKDRAAVQQTHRVSPVTCTRGKASSTHFTR